MPTRPSSFEPIAVDVSFTYHVLRVLLRDGREISVPIAWFPRLRKATFPQRRNWRLIGGGIGIHWEDVDEDILVDSLLATGKMLWFREAQQSRKATRRPARRTSSRR